MQVLFGEFKGRRLLAPKDGRIRPTTGRMRDWLANVLRDRFEGARVLDLYAGSGALGIEALSLGAREATFVDRAPQALRLIRTNLERLGAADRATVLRDDALRFLRAGRAGGGPWNLVFVDPPYDETDFGELMAALENADILERDGRLAIEHPGGLADPRLGRPAPGGAPAAAPGRQAGGGRSAGRPALALVRQKAFGRSTISLFAHDADDDRS